jgi:hypothetical protein
MILDEEVIKRASPFIPLTALWGVRITKRTDHLLQPHPHNTSLINLELLQRLAAAIIPR